MIKTILSIIGIIAIIWFLCVHIANIILYVIYAFTTDMTYESLVRSTSTYPTESGEWYIIPTISIYKNNGYFTFTFTWFKWIFNTEYHFRTEEEDDLYRKAFQELKSEEDNKNNKKK